MNLGHKYDKLCYVRTINGGKGIAKFYRTNLNIQTPNLRVIGPDGEQLGVLTRQAALEKAHEQELDLIEIAPNADPPVARILDFKKFRYEESKKEKAAKKGSDTGLKELWLSPRIAEHDLLVRLKRANEFLDDGHKVKLTVKFKGREMAHPEAGHKVLQMALAHFGNKVTIERESKFEGRKLSMIMGRIKTVKKEEANDETKNE